LTEYYSASFKLQVSMS